MTGDHNNTARVYQGAARTDRGLSRRARVLICALAVAFASSACSRESPSERVEQERKTVASWAASLHLLCDAWREGSVPSPYTIKSLENAREALTQESQTLREDLSKGEAEPQRGAALLDELSKLDALAVAASEAVRANDRGAAGGIAGSLSQEQGALSDLSREVGAR